MKFEIPAKILIEAPATKVWQVIAHEFAEIGTWAAAIPHSTTLTTAQPLTDAPIKGRACQTSVPGFQTVHEQFIYYNKVAMSFGYEAVAGMPWFIQRAENHWAVHTVDTQRSQVQIVGKVEVINGLGWLIAPLFRRQLGRTGRFTLEELKYYIEKGKPHPRKIRTAAHKRETATHGPNR